VQAHPNVKGFKAQWLERDTIFTVGWGKQTDAHQFALWDARNLTEAFYVQNLEAGPSLLIPYYDPGTNIMFLAGKVSKL
jgi:hypothetical protein